MMEHKGRRMRKGWFRVRGLQDGDRTLEEQLKGLASLLLEVRGKHVLDLGCAEGLISDACISRGAEAAFGLEINQASVKVGQSLVDAKVALVHFDLNRTPSLADCLAQMPGVDICLMLAVLHKLRKPLDLIDLVARAKHPELFVVRLPALMPGFVKDHRSGNIRFDLTARFGTLGYMLKEVDRGHYDEWTGYYARSK